MRIFDNKWKFKTIDNAIVEEDREWHTKVIFKPVSSFETERYIDKMVCGYGKAVQARIPPLLLIPAVIHDFLAFIPLKTVTAE